MCPEKLVKPTKSSFTDEQIRVKAYQLWEKNKEQSPEENWNAAVEALERERFWRPLISVWRWTGIGEKKGWDIIQLLSTVSIPVLLFFGTQYFSTKSNEQQQKIAEEKQKDELLKTYINDMKASLLDKDHPLKKSKENHESRSIARTITLTTLTQLNSEQYQYQQNIEQDQQKAKEGNYNRRKGLIIQFLFESDLIKFAPKVDSIISLNTADLAFSDFYKAILEGTNLEVDSIISLNTADLAFADFYKAKLESANLESANLYSANLYSANLESANLSSAYLYSAILYSAKLESANLYSAYLYSAYLYSAYLYGANLYSAYLYSANLYNASLYGAKNLTNKQIKSACFWEKAIYTKSEFDETMRWIPKDPKANQRKIDEIRQDKASDPSIPPDCSYWNSR